MHIRRSRKQFHAPTPYGDPPPPEPVVLPPARRLVTSDDGLAYSFHGKVRRSIAQPDAQEAPAYNPNVMQRRWGRSFDVADGAILQGKVFRKNAAVVPGPYPEVAQTKRSRVVRCIDDFMHIFTGKVMRRRVPIEPEVSFARPQGRRMARGNDAPFNASGGIIRTRLIVTDPETVIGTQRPILRRPVYKPTNEPEPFWGRVIRSAPQSDPIGVWTIRRRFVSVYEVPPNPVIFKRGFFHTGLTGDPPPCPERPIWVDESCSAASFTEDECSRPAIVEESSDLPAAPVNPDDCC